MGNLNTPQSSPETRESGKLDFLKGIFSGKEAHASHKETPEDAFHQNKEALRQLAEDDQYTAFEIRAWEHADSMNAFLDTSEHIDTQGNISLTEGAEFTVTLWGNEKLEMGIGAGHILPPHVREITITPYDAVNHVLLHDQAVSGTRDIRGGKIGYFDRNDAYIPIFSGYRIRIKAIGDPEDFKDAYEEEQEIKQADIEMERMLEEERAALREEFGLEKLPDTKRDFIHIASELAKRVERIFGIPWQVTVAQSTLESGFGQSGLTRTDHNFFGIKQWWGHRGENARWDTNEYYDGKTLTREKGSAFCRYETIVDSFLDYGRFLTMNERYAGAFQYKDDPRRFLEEVISVGYATDPTYVEKAVNAVGGYGVLM